jgi:hypothetical protein
LTYALIEGIARAGSGDHVRLYDFADYVRTEVPKLSRELEGCKVTGPEGYCQKPAIGLDNAENYPVLPRSAKVLALIDAEGPIISKKPTHAVMVAAELFETANRGGVAKRQLQRGELVTLIKTENGWAYIAKGASRSVTSRTISFSNSKNSSNGVRPQAEKSKVRGSRS